MVNSFNCGKPFAHPVAPAGIVLRRPSGDRILGTVDGYSQVMQIVWSLQDRNDGRVHSRVEQSMDGTSSETLSPRIAARAFSVIEDHTLDPAFWNQFYCPQGAPRMPKGRVYPSSLAGLHYEYPKVRPQQIVPARQPIAIQFV
jgi:hypothetical protein